MKHLYAFALFLSIPTMSVYAQDATVQVNADAVRVAVAPYRYGRNNNFSTYFGSPTTAADITFTKRPVCILHVKTEETMPPNTTAMFKIRSPTNWTIA